MSRARGVMLAVVALLALAGPAHAKKYRYQGGPQAPGALVWDALKLTQAAESGLHSRVRKPGRVPP